MPRSLFATVLELFGIAAIATAGWLVNPSLGLALLGLALLVIGFVLDDPTDPARLPAPDLADDDDDDDLGAGDD